MRSPLDVVLTSSTDTSKVDHIAGRLADFQQTSTSPGGFASVSCTFDMPVASDYLRQFDTVAVYDRGTVEQVGGGRLTDPGKSADENGEVWAISAIGEGPSHMADQTKPYVLIETSCDGFFAKNRFGGSSNMSVGPTPDGVTPSSETAIVLSEPGGAVLGNGVCAAAFYDRLSDCGQALGGYGYTRIAGRADAGYQIESAVYGLGGSPALATITSQNFNAAAAAVAAKVTGTDFTAGADVLRFCIRRSGGAITVADDTTWGGIYSLYVAARRLLKTGSFETNANHANAYVLASEAVADMLGRFLTRFDGTNATVTATTTQLDQLAWPDGVTPGQVMDELLQFERAMTWHVWEMNPATGKYAFEFVPWSTSVRYESNILDGFTSPSPSTDLYNAVNVRYRSQSGRTRILNVTGGTTALGYTRTGWLDLSDEVGSAANAARAGAQWLLDHTYPPNAGTLRIARPIMDLTYGRMVKPWAIRPGTLIRVRGVRPYIDSLNASDKDGVTVFRVKSVSYSDSDGAATLELDTYTRTEARAIADLATRRTRKR